MIWYLIDDGDHVASVVHDPHGAGGVLELTTNPGWCLGTSGEHVRWCDTMDEVRDLLQRRPITPCRCMGCIPPSETELAAYGPSGY